VLKKITPFAKDGKIDSKDIGKARLTLDEMQSIVESGYGPGFTGSAKSDLKRLVVQGRTAPHVKAAMEDINSGKFQDVINRLEDLKRHPTDSKYLDTKAIDKIIDNARKHIAAGGARGVQGVAAIMQDIPEYYTEGTTLGKQLSRAKTKAKKVQQGAAPQEEWVTFR
jgi:hypothetical protein